MMGVDLGVSLTNACVALAGATIVANDLMAAWLLVPPATMLLIAYRAYSSEQAKHRSLEFLYGVTRSLSNGNDLEPELLDLMRRTRTSFRVRTAETVLLSGDGGLRTGLSSGGPDEAMTTVGAADASALRQVVQASHAVIVDRDDCAPGLERYLESRGIVQALIAPVRSETGLAGVMVLGDRMGADPEFTDEDLRLIEALATHAGFSLELDRLEREAQSDPLTGLANRTLFQRRVEASLARGTGSATVLFLDLDDFKAINDRAGHAAGDAVLVAAAGRIEAAVRPDDVAARFGGDEFAVLLEDVDDHHGEQVAGRILDLFAEPVTIDGESMWVRSSVGIATASAGSLAADQLLRQADIAMYRAKEAGKSQVRVWFPEMQPAAENGETGRGELAAALELGEVVAHFQPIVSLEDDSVVAVEALARWRHPRRGLVGAASFVRDADPDLMAAVDREVLSQACAIVARGDAPAVHVNIAALDAATVRDVMASSGVEPERLVLELSERALAEAPDTALSALRAIGVRIAFDDFGSGQRALDVLRSRPVDIVKVARPYVDGAGRGAHDRAMLSMIVQIGSMYGLQVIAQGIEREDQRAGLAALGCELGQGYLLGRPLPQVAVATRTAVS
jgi:diguanylate cyclase (GGDEF)-like protein